MSVLTAILQALLHEAQRAFNHDADIGLDPDAAHLALGGKLNACTSEISLNQGITVLLD